EEPSADFTARVLARIAEAEKPKPTLWQRIREFFSPTVMRWAVATAALLLIAAVALTQYQSRFRSTEGTIARSVENDSSSEALAKLKASNEGGKLNVTPDSIRPPIQQVYHHIAKHRVQPRVHHEPEQSRMPEGEIA